MPSITDTVAEALEQTEEAGEEERESFAAGSAAEDVRSDAFSFSLLLPETAAAAAPPLPLRGRAARPHRALFVPRSNHGPDRVAAATANQRADPGLPRGARVLF